MIQIINQWNELPKQLIPGFYEGKDPTSLKTRIIINSMNLLFIFKRLNRENNKIDEYYGPIWKEIEDNISDENNKNRINEEEINVRKEIENDSLPKEIEKWMKIIQENIEESQKKNIKSQNKSPKLNKEFNSDDKPKQSKIDIDKGGKENKRHSPNEDDEKSNNNKIKKRKKIRYYGEIQEEISEEEEEEEEEDKYKLQHRNRKNKMAITVDKSETSQIRQFPPPQDETYKTLTKVAEKLKGLEKEKYLKKESLWSKEIKTLKKIKA
uniref:Uncharacterized protein n=1 Tax=Meloidogyne hapla TaxID=6305 RepID=A0A1I8BEN0_MELHA